jgi:subtilisin family serine protease
MSNKHIIKKIVMKKVSFAFGFVLLSFVLNAQSPYYYYYNGEKQYLTLDTKNVFLSIKEQKLPVHFNLIKIKHKELQSDESDKKQYRSRKGNVRFWTELNFEEHLSEELYLKKLSDIKQQNPDAIVSPYFKISENDKIGLSNFFYVKLKSLADTTILAKTVQEKKCIIIEQDAFMPLWFVLSITEQTDNNAMKTANLFYESGLFQAAEPNLMVDVTQCVNDTYWGQQWGLSNTGQYGGTNGIDIKACNAWQLSLGNNVTVAVIDHGIALTHPDLSGNISQQSFDTENGSSPSIVRGNHGTACAGIVGAVRNNSAGISGVAPSCNLMSISSTLSLNTLNIQQHLAGGINWAWQNGADVISNSWGNNALQGTFITDAINNAVIQGRNGLGCVVVFSSGNENASSVNYPASLPNVIAVGAISPCGQRKSPTSCDGETTWGSNYGTNLDVVAPGVLIPTTDIQGNVGYNPNVPIHTGNGGNKITSDYTNQDYTVWFNGTSAACPHVSGIAALILSVRPDLTQAQVRKQ